METSHVFLLERLSALQLGSRCGRRRFVSDASWYYHLCIYLSICLNALNALLQSPWLVCCMHCCCICLDKFRRPTATAS